MRTNSGVNKPSRKHIGTTYRGFTGSVRKMVLRAYCGFDPQIFLTWDTDLRALTANVPSLVVWGDRDPYMASPFASRFGALKVTRFPHCVHWPMVEIPDIVSRKLLAHFSNDVALAVKTAVNSRATLGRPKLARESIAHTSGSRFFAGATRNGPVRSVSHCMRDAIRYHAVTTIVSAAVAHKSKDGPRSCEAGRPYLSHGASTPEPWVQGVGSGMALGSSASDNRSRHDSFPTNARRSSKGCFGPYERDR